MTAKCESDGARVIPRPDAASPCHPWRLRRALSSSRDPRKRARRGRGDRTHPHGRMARAGEPLRQADRRLVGVAPLNRDSGQQRGYRAIGGGRAHLRRMLSMAAMGAATRNNARLKAFYRKLRSAGKKPKMALVAVMRKLIVILTALIRTNQTWTPKTA